LLELARHVLIDSDARRRSPGGGLGASDAWRLLRAWLGQMELELDTAGLIAALQGPTVAHADLERRARRLHERKAYAAIEALTTGERDEPEAIAAKIFSACVPAVPYVRASALLCGERERLAGGEEDPVRVAVVADGLSTTPGLAGTLEQLRERGIAGHEIEVIGTDAGVDQRLAAVAEVELPFFPAGPMGVPSLFAVADVLSGRRYDLVHLCGPGPAGIGALLIARMIGVPVAGSYHTDLNACARIRGCEPALERGLESLLAAFYGACGIVFSPSQASDAALRQQGIRDRRLVRWEPGVDCMRWNPARYCTDALPPERFNVLWTAPLDGSEDAELICRALLTARDREPRLHLVVTGDAPDDGRLRTRLKTAATFLGPIGGDALASVYASADLFVSPMSVDLFGQELLQAQASALPVLAVDHGHRAESEFIENGRSGLLVPPEPRALADALRGLARRNAVRERLATGGMLAARERSWERSLAQLTAGYRRAIAPADAGAVTSGPVDAGAAALATEVPRAA
jgi:glycosyltransferase involved in cell wall biosynthesis